LQTAWRSADVGPDDDASPLEEAWKATLGFVNA
jgi:hypothetical protein